MPSLTEKLCAWAEALSYESLPPQIVRQARRCLFDTIGAALAGASLSPSGRAGRSFAASLDEPGNSTVIGAAFKRSAMTAALVNGMAAHALELDDGSKYATYHPGSSIVTMSLALGEAHGVTGRRLIEAVVAGYESSLRIGTAINPGHYLSGFHPTGTVATFGTAMAACKILGLSAEASVGAMGLAGSLASGINQYEIDGAISKHLHPGNAARNGILSALLAHHGMIGPPEILEGRLGFFHCFAPEADPSIVDAALGSDWHMERIYFKPFCSCRYVHYAIEAAQKNLEKRPAAPEEIERIVVRTHQNAKQGSDIPDYRTPLHARLSIQYGIASILARGRAGLREYEDAAIADPALRGLSDLVTIEVDDEIQRAYPNPRSMIVEFAFTDGTRVSSRIDHAKGDAENPISDEELIGKYKDVTEDVISPEKAGKIIGAFMTTEELAPAADLARLLGATS